METKIEKIEQSNSLKMNSLISIKPYSDPNIVNMGLENYGLALFEGTSQEESIMYLDPTGNGKKRYITGLNEFAPEVQALPIDEKEAKIKDIRECVAKIERYFGNNIDPKDKNFWDKVETARVNNYDFWESITIKLSNSPIYLDPVNDIYDLIKLKAIEAGGFSLIATSLEDVIRKSSKGVKFYLDKLEDTVTTKTELKKVRNKALAELNKLYETNIDKLFLVCKVIDANSAQYKKNTPNDVYYDNMDNYINGYGVETNKRKAAKEFLDVVNLDFETLKLRAIVKDATYYNLIGLKGDGNIYHLRSNTMLGKNPSEVVEYLKNPLNEDIMQQIMNYVEKLWIE